MKVAASTVKLAGAHGASTRDEVHETMRAWIGDKRPDFEAAERHEKPSLAPGAISISGAAHNTARVTPSASTTAAIPPQSSSEAQAIQDAIDRAEHDPMLELIRMMVEILSGRRVGLLSAHAMQVDAPAIQVTDSKQAAPVQSTASQHAGFGVEYDRHEVHEESEQTSFQAQGTVHTSDGKDIDFTVGLAMQRSYREESNVSIRAGDGIRKDPLVINFAGTAAQLQSRRFSFDLDGDGKKETVPLLGANSGYLAFDLNGNNKIDSGKELFGPASGDGFAELARHDSDGNGWIDENDPIFELLRVWTPDAKGSGTLASLKERGIEALFLGYSATQFAIKDGANRALGAVRATGAYLAQSGAAGTVQQIDLMV